MSADRLHWFRVAFQLEGSVATVILPRVLLCGGFGVLISILYAFKGPVSWPMLSSLVPSIVLGLLLVFRTNTAYDRFWEGRRLWGSLTINITNLARQIWVLVEERDPQDRQKKEAALRLLAAFAVAMKLSLRGEPVNSELEEFISHSRYIKLQNMTNPPLEIAFWIGDYVKQQHKRNCLTINELILLNQPLSNMIEAFSGCMRILKTPMPLAYSIHLKQLLLIYCLALPFQMVKDLTWLTGPFVALVSFTLFGIEAIGLEIENPFGYDRNDLPLDSMCDSIKRNIEDLMSLPPSVRAVSNEGMTPIME